MDRDRSRRYLRAMGVQLWWPRDEDNTARQLDRTPVPPGHAEQAGANGHGARATPGNVSRVRHDRFPHPSPLPEGKGGVVRATRDFHGKESGIPSDVGADRPPSAAAEPIPTSEIAGMDWETLRQAVSSCRACELCKTRTQTVFGAGNRQADLMIIGEAPGADEDRQGEPFVGRAGQLLNLMLEAIGLKREQVYIANILKCRPPGNRDPRPEEAQRCEPYLMRQIALVQPRVLLSVGRISAQKLLKTDTPIGKLRGRWFEFGPDDVPLTVTYHPAYLLRSPDQKSKAWQDLLQVVRRLRDPAVESGRETAD